MAVYGKYDAQGAVEQEATECILTGREVTPRNSVRERVPGTPFFYRIISHQYHRVTEALRDEWRTGATPALPLRVEAAFEVERDDEDDE